jgi:hypothetical protein
MKTDTRTLIMTGWYTCEDSSAYPLIITYKSQCVPPLGIHDPIANDMETCTDIINHLIDKEYDRQHPETAFTVRRKFNSNADRQRNYRQRHAS